MTHGGDDQDLDRDLEAIAARFEAERPVPRAPFRGDLRRRLIATPAEVRRSRRRVLALVAAYSGFGFALLAVAAVGLAGAGPLAA